MVSTLVDVEPAASAASAADVVMAWCEILLAPGERSVLHCSEHAVASGCCSVSDYRKMSVQVGSSADGECGGWLGCGNCTIAQLLKCASRKSAADLG